MNSPRDHLLRRHASAVPRLDELRGRLVTGMAVPCPPRSRHSAGKALWRWLCFELLGFGTRTATALGAMALIAGGLEIASRRHLAMEPSTSMVGGNRVATRDAAPVLRLVDSLRDGRRVLEDLGGESESARDGDDPASPVPSPVPSPARRPVGNRSQAPALHERSRVA